jgi:hypothetical protein
MGLWTWIGVDASMGWFGVPWGNFYAWLFVTAGFSLVTRWLREAARSRAAWEWLQLLVPIPAFGLLLIGLAPFIALKPLGDSAPGGGGALFLVTLAAFAAVAAWAVFGPDRGRPDGERVAILDLRLATGTRIAIHIFFLVSLLSLGLALELPLLLVAAIVLLAAELPLARLVRRRHARAAAETSDGTVPDLGAAAAARYR